MAVKRHNKILGVSVGERSMLIADVAAGEKPDVRKLAEFVYPEGTTLADAAQMGPALADFLKRQGISTTTTVIGLPAKWLVVKSKEVPPTDPATLADMLRLQAESDFSSELKDLVYDYAGTGPVLLVATQKKYVDSAAAVCEAAGLNAVGVTSSAMALADATGGDMVLAVSATGAELTGAHGSSIKHLRGPATERAFVGELRRAVSTIPSNGGGRELTLWDGVGLNATTLSGDLGFPVRSAMLASMGVKSPNATGEAKFAPAALAALGEKPLGVDFLDSKLAVDTSRTIPRWAWIAAVAAVVLIVAGVMAYRDLGNQEAEVLTMKTKLDGMASTITSAEQFVSRVTFASGWRIADPRYLACLRDITEKVPDDNQTYGTRLQIHEATRTVSGKTTRTGDLTGSFFGKTSDQELVQKVIEQLKANPAFTELSFGEMKVTGRTRETSFEIKFVYRPPVSKAAAK